MLILIYGNVDDDVVFEFAILFVVTVDTNSEDYKLTGRLYSNGSIGNGSYYYTRGNISLQFQLSKVHEDDRICLIVV